MLDIAEKTGLYLAFVWAPVNPYILEGIKTISYEIAAQLPAAPDVIVCSGRRRRHAHRSMARLSRT